jgi:hypothetical protein
MVPSYEARLFAPPYRELTEAYACARYSRAVRLPNTPADLGWTVLARIAAWNRDDGKREPQRPEAFQS